jgi:hypothetical protein
VTPASIICRARAAALLLTATLLAFAAPLRAAGDASMETEIDYLVNAVADSSCTFIRNGKEHDATAAGEHLQMKRQRGKRHYDTTELFIERIASRSSWSGEDYLIRCPGSEPQTANEWFKARLAEYRAAAPD